MDAWFESVVILMAVAAIGITALGSRVEFWQPVAASARVSSAAGDSRCIALHADAADHQPKCATTVALAHTSGTRSTERNIVWQD